MKKFILSASLALLGLTSVPAPSQAQLLLVTGDYRITELDEGNQRFGVALPEAKPDVTQNWCYVQPNTDITRKLTNAQGWTKEDKLNYYQFFQNARPGQMVRIHGGRRWDGGISGKTLQLGGAEDPRS